MKNESVVDIYIEGDRLLELTQTMLKAAKSDDWDTFEMLEQQRGEALEEIFGNQANAETAKLYLADVVDKIRLIDQAICNLIIQERDLAAEELRRLKHARKGNKAYQMAVDNSLE
jgi:hypothetical protein